MNTIELRESWERCDVIDDLVDHAQRVAYVRSLTYMGEPVPSLATPEHRQRARDISEGAPGAAYIRCARAADKLSGEVAPYYIASALLHSREESTSRLRAADRHVGIDLSTIVSRPRPVWEYNPASGIPSELRPVATLLAGGEGPSKIARDLGLARKTVQRHTARLRALLPNPNTLIGGAYYGLLSCLHDDRRVDCT